MDIRGMLEKVQSGEMDIPQAEELLKKLPYEDLGYAKLDHHRRLRSGFGEVVFCQGKPDEYLREIFRR
ncbi:MAG: 1-(5-phosphoribosyl)-5-amino-4-imidazole-carboxylate carboxylase, partial [Lachnospiraceae bacterium]|nr:1-(5-phosphoribosyl)-5-amino-4-imidazole-carboxylate carboxylase [Lachnospiraceae bacterium]